MRRPVFRHAPGGHPFTPLEESREREPGLFGVAGDELRLRGKESGDDDPAARSESIGKEGKKHREQVAKEVRGDEVVGGTSFLGHQSDRVALDKLDLVSNAVSHCVLYRVTKSHAIIFNRDDPCRSESRRRDCEDAATASQVDRAPFVARPLRRKVGEEAQATGRGGMFARSEGKLGRKAEKDASWMLPLERRERLWLVGSRH